MINKRISNLSFDKNEFNKAKGVYDDALSSSGFNEKLRYEAEHAHVKRRKRSRKIIWFNPPYNTEVQTKIGKIFLNLIRKHFPKRHHFSKIFNTNTIKISYCCSSNMENIIKQHNGKILNVQREKEIKPCNCRDQSNCPLDGKCLATCIIYKAEVVSNGVTSSYYGTCEGEFKSRYNNHTKSFRSRKYENDTELSKHIWRLKDNSREYRVIWSIERTARPYKCGTKRCDLCLSEKVAIIRANTNGLLNKRTELISKCRHRNKFLVANVK